MTRFFCAYLSLWQVLGATSQKGSSMRHPIRRLFRKELPQPLPVVITAEPDRARYPSDVWDDRRRGAVDTSDHFPRCSESALMCWEELVGRR